MIIRKSESQERWSEKRGNRSRRGGEDNENVEREVVREIEKRLVEKR